MDKKKRRRGKKDEAGGEAADKEQGEDAPTGPTEVIKEIVTEDGTVMTIKEVIPGAQEAEEAIDDDDEEEEEEEADGTIQYTALQSRVPGNHQD